jgi:selenocysteine lyase/cysteine desulfurase
VAFLAHASEGLNQAVHAVDWRPGDNAVVADLEYPSLIYPVSALRARGVEVWVIETRDHYLSLDRLAAAVDRRTRLVLVSHVSYLTGQRVDLARCAAIARAAGAWLAVDATHALGVAPVPGELCDFVVSSSGRSSERATRTSERASSMSSRSRATSSPRCSRSSRSSCR